MLRLRRYRLALICAFIITVLLYHVSKNSQWDHSQEILYGKTGSRVHPKIKPNPKPEPPPRPEHDHEHEPEHEHEQHGHRPPPPKTPAPEPHDSNDQPLLNAEPTIRIPQLKTSEGIPGGYGLPTRTPLPPRPANADEEDNGAVGRPKPTKAAPTVPDKDTKHQEDILPTSTIVHWQKPTEWFPVPEESLIMLPTGKVKPIPRVQFAFAQESPEAKEKRELRLAKVKAEAQRAWSGYKTYAWTHDELTPVSKHSKDPFCGWAATLVDSLDTLWIMGMKDEFEDAVEAVKKIDFTTTPYREDIPVFETIIRYLGGLIGAYDVTGGQEGKYPILLHKAIELADILMSVFDTPNRMPILYYSWKPAYNQNPKRASADVSVAELGSMSMEFTRLAQLTGKNKYYDAIARITNALEELQNREYGTAIPGIFPEHLDPSGCNRTAGPVSTVENSSAAAQKQARDDGRLASETRGYKSSGNKGDAEAGKAAKGGAESDASRSRRRSAETDVGSNTGFHRGPQKRDGISGPLNAKGLPPNFDCVPQGLVAGGWGMGSYSMGASQDSAYEYFPKQYVLLGGLEPKYRTMHEKVADAVKQYLLFRPMAEGDPDVLFSAKAYSPDGTAEKLSYEWEVTHLTCFLGGMFGLGGKIFERPEDVEVAKRLTDGCVWAYDVMPTGIMPEYATVIPCKRPDDCRWNQTAWYEKLDPSAEYRESQIEEYYVKKAEWKAQVAELKEKAALQKEAEERKRREEAQRRADGEEEREKRPAQNASPPSESQKRDSLNDFGSQAVTNSRQDAAVSTVDEAKVKKLESSLDLNSNSGRQGDTPSYQDGHGDTSDQKPMGKIFIPPAPVKPLTHLEYVTDRIQKEHIPPGFVTLNDKRYILRPEAIESVWYMYRITGDPEWQEKGWRMFESVVRATRTEVGHSAIQDVTSTDRPVLEDSMESFWLAETLKYFYLLFATPDVISLDEWVLNTEAHPFRRPR
ncbi:hypothetical protein VTK56DRAFT_9048 [Thermocarpiscus australiensis]